MRDDDFSTDLRSTESASGDWSFPSAGTGPPAADFQSLYDRERVRAARERARADAAEARCEELRWAEVAARSDAGSWKSRFEASRQKRQAAVEEAKEARRAAKDALSSEAEVARLKKLLADAGVDTGKGVAVAPQRMTAQEPRARQNTPRSRSVRQLRKAWRRHRPRRTRSGRCVTRTAICVKPSRRRRARRAPSGRCRG